MPEINSHFASPSEEPEGVFTPPEPTAETGGADDSITTAEADMLSDLQPEDDPDDDETSTDDAPSRPLDGGNTSPAAERTSYLERPVVGIRERPGQPPQPIEVPTRLVARGLIMAERTRQAAIDLFPPDRDGLDIERVGAFLANMGVLPTETTIEVPVKDRGTVLRSLQPLGVDAPEPGLSGMYIPQIDTVFTFRDGRLEELNGPEITDKDRLHELGHSGGAYSRWFVDRGGLPELTDAQMGLAWQDTAGNPYNKLVDEGVQEYLAGTYVAEELNRPGGLANLATTQHDVRRYSSPGTISVPSRYTFLDRAGRVDIAASAFAATAIGHLIDRDPALLPALIAGARDDEAFREATGRMEAIAPGMPDTLKNNFNTHTQYENGLDYVRGILGLS